MINFTDMTGLLGIAFGLAALSSLALGKLLPHPRVSAVVVGAVFVLLLVPFAELPLAAYVRGMVGDPAITSLLLLGYAVARRAGVVPPLSASQRFGALLLLALAAATLYPLALGAAPYDSYRWGYGEPWFLGLLLAIALAGMALRMPMVVVAISLAVLGWAVGWYESGNLWDYLLDPLLALFSLCALPRAFGLCRRAI